MFSKKLPFPEENQSKQIANLPNIAVLLSTVNPEKMSQLTMLGNSGDISQVDVGTNQIDQLLSNSSIALTLPSKVFSFSSRKNQKVVFILYRKTGFFQSSTKNKSKGSSSIRSYVISAFVVGEVIKDLDDPIVIRYPDSDRIDVRKTLCVFWNFDATQIGGDWSESGCKFHRKDDENKHHECRCNHLTNFAMLLVGSNGV